MTRTQRIGIGILAVALSGLVMDRLVIGYDTAPAGDEASAASDDPAVRVDALLALLGETDLSAGRLSGRLGELASLQDDALLDHDVFAMPMAWSAPPAAIAGDPAPDTAQTPAPTTLGLQLTSVMLGRRPMARFGDELRFVGDEIAGLVIVGIDEDGVELSRQGSRFRLPVGESGLVALVGDDH